MQEIKRILERRFKGESQWIFHLFDDTVLIQWRQCVNQIDDTRSSSKKEVCSLVFFEHSSLIFYSNSLTLIDLLPLIWMKYEFAVILSNIASAIALLPKFSCHPCGINCEANIVEWVLYLNSNNSKISDCCSEVVGVNRNSPIMNNSILDS